MWLIVSLFIVHMVMLYFVQTLLSLSPKSVNKLLDRLKVRVALLVIAHPDDECMFFTPAIISLLKQHVVVYLLCLSNGDSKGLGKIREKELEASCKALGIPAANLKIVDHPNLQDSSNAWNPDIISKVVGDHIASINVPVDLLVTFDQGGVSGHPNHKSLAHGLTHMQRHTSRRLRVLYLSSVSLWRKYVGPLTFFVDLLAIHMRTGAPNRNWIAAITWNEAFDYGFMSMRQHQSQLLWFRWLYLFFSRYMIVNTFELYESSYNMTSGKKK